MFKGALGLLFCDLLCDLTTRFTKQARRAQSFVNFVKDIVFLVVKNEKRYVQQSKIQQSGLI